MYKAKDGLEEQQDKDDGADDWVVAVKQIDRDVVHHPDSKAKSDDVYDVCKELDDAVYQPYATERSQSNHDGSDREEQDECKGGENAMCDQDFLPTVDVGLCWSAPVASN